MAAENILRRTSPQILNLVPSNSKDCGLEGVGSRPKDCPNNPWKKPENHRPNICGGCPADENLWQVAKEPLPAKYIELKQKIRKFPSQGEVFSEQSS
jgi:hypothetical protein